MLQADISLKLTIKEVNADGQERKNRRKNKHN